MAEMRTVIDLVFVISQHVLPNEENCVPVSSLNGNSWLEIVATSTTSEANGAEMLDNKLLTKEQLLHFNPTASSAEARSLILSLVAARIPHVEPGSEPLTDEWSTKCPQPLLSHAALQWWPAGRSSLPELPGAWAAGQPGVPSQAAKLEELPLPGEAMGLGGTPVRQAIKPPHAATPLIICPTLCASA